MLKVSGINVYYGVIHAIKDISLHVEEGDVVSLIGANGAGKTTILQTISGMLRSKTGSIELMGKDISKTEPHNILKMGMAHVPEGRRVFTTMSVLENLEMGAFTRKDPAEIASNLEKVFASFPRLEERKKQVAGTLSGGEQQMLAIGRALMSNPKILLLDEPSMGLSPLLVEEIFNIIKILNREGMTILLVEQNANKALGIAKRGYVLETGNIVMEAAGQELLNNDEVRRAYLGL